MGDVTLYRGILLQRAQLDAPVDQTANNAEDGRVAGQLVEKSLHEGTVSRGERFDFRQQRGQSLERRANQRSSRIEMTLSKSLTWVFSGIDRTPRTVISSA